MIYFSFLPPYPALLSPNDRIALPHHSPPAELPSLYLFCHTRVFLVGCCVCFFPAGGHLRPQPILFSIFYSPSIQRLVRRDKTPPYIPTQSPILSNAPPNVDAYFWLVVVSPHMERERQSRWRVGWAAHLVECCVLCFVFCALCFVFCGCLANERKSTAKPKWLIFSHSQCKICAKDL
jgi:hypothetical protein